jgi:hypothetical protein
LRRFHQVMRTAKASTIGNVERCATITNLDGMIGKHAIEWLCPSAANAMCHDLASATGSSDDLCSPRSKLG